MAHACPAAAVSTATAPAGLVPAPNAAVPGALTDAAGLASRTSMPGRDAVAPTVRNALSRAPSPSAVDALARISAARRPRRARCR
ncbi:hypothetical protein ACFQV2_27245 [Actinokineospora soli]|uniref:Uncharacterized protein n=1 Tax=Actinokineospora soli TaxID=1048753 RepID=A0ABW2TRY8_9PSEU